MKSLWKNHSNNVTITHKNGLHRKKKTKQNKKKSERNALWKIDPSRQFGYYATRLSHDFRSSVTETSSVNIITDHKPWNIQKGNYAPFRSRRRKSGEKHN
jgi:hypothetical protein